MGADPDGVDVVSARHGGGLVHPKLPMTGLDRPAVADLQVVHEEELV
jgi:hypothetical protein